MCTSYKQWNTIQELYSSLTFPESFAWTLYCSHPYIPTCCTGNLSLFISNASINLNNANIEKHTPPACSVLGDTTSLCRLPHRNHSIQGRTFPSHSLWQRSTKQPHRITRGSIETATKIKKNKNRRLTVVCLTKGPRDRQLSPPACHTQPLSWFRGVYTHCNSCCPLGGAPEKKRGEGWYNALYTQGAHCTPAIKLLTWNHICQ